MNALRITPNACGVLAAMIALIGGTVQYTDGSQLDVSGIGGAGKKYSPKQMDAILHRDSTRIRAVKITVQGDQLPCGTDGTSPVGLPQAVPAAPPTPLSPPRQVPQYRTTPRQESGVLSNLKDPRPLPPGVPGRIETVSIGGPDDPVDTSVGDIGGFAGETLPLVERRNMLFTMFLVGLVVYLAYLFLQK